MGRYQGFGNSIHHYQKISEQKTPGRNNRKPGLIQENGNKNTPYDKTHVFPYHANYKLNKWRLLIVFCYISDWVNPPISLANSKFQNFSGAYMVARK